MPPRALARSLSPPVPGRGSPRRSPCVRREAPPRRSCPTPPVSTACRAHAAGGGTRRGGSGEVPPRSSSRSGCRTRAPRSSPWRRRLCRAGRRRRRAASHAAPDPRAPRPLRRTHRGRRGPESAYGARLDARTAAATPCDTVSQGIEVLSCASWPTLLRFRLLRSSSPLRTRSRTGSSPVVPRREPASSSSRRTGARSSRSRFAAGATRSESPSRSAS